MPKFKVVITRVDSVPAMAQGEWKTLEERPWTEEELNNNAQAYNQAEFLEKNPLKKIYGHTPDRPTTQTVETKVLEQVIDDLDIAAVIKAVNKL